MPENDGMYRRIAVEPWSQSRIADHIGRHATEAGLDEFVADRNECSSRSFRLRRPSSNLDAKNCVEILV